MTLAQRRWAQGTTRRIAALEKSIAQAEYIKWPALQASFEADLYRLKQALGNANSVKTKRAPARSII